MNIVKVLRSLGPIDVRNIRRDSLVAWMIYIPILMAVVLRFSLPFVHARLLEQYNFDLTQYYTVLLSYFFIGTCPMVFGAVIGFLLLDEKDDRTLTALQVTPMPLSSYIVYRVSIPIVLTFVMLIIIFPLANLTPFNLKVILISALASSPMAPMFALFLASIAENKIQGFALMKLTGIFLLAPVFAYFVTSSWELVFGLLPTYWPLKVYWMLSAGEPNVWLYVAIAVIYQLLITAFFAKRFYKVLHQ
jgi:fluoroquinolone transport system permease protein